MKIALLQDDFPPRHVGGAGVVAHAMAHELLRQGHEVIVITTVRSVQDAGVSVVDGLTIHSIASSYPARFRAWVSLWNPRVVRKVYALLAKFQPDVVHAHNIHTHLSYRCLRIAKRLNAKVFLTAHDVMLFNYGKLTEPFRPDNLSCTITTYRVSPWRLARVFRTRYNPFRNAVIKHSLRYVDRIVAVSAELEKALGQNGIKNTTVLHNGIDSVAWYGTPSMGEQHRKEHTLEGKKIVLVGATSALKGGGQALQAIAEVTKRVPNAVLLVVGTKNAYVEKMIAVAREKNISENVMFTGWLSGQQLITAYTASDVVLMPSICFDTFGMVCLEAMSNSKPVVATCFGGAKEILVEGETGYIVNPFDVSAVAEKLIELLSDPEKAARFGVAGKKRVEEHFELANQVRNYVKLFEGSL